MNNKNISNIFREKEPHLSNEIIQTNGTEETGAKPCNCEKSQCLKLYCECFSRNELCNKFCNCRDCKNDGLNLVC